MKDAIDPDSLSKAMHALNFLHLVCEKTKNPMFSLIKGLLITEMVGTVPITFDESLKKYRLSNSGSNVTGTHGSLQDFFKKTPGATGEFLALLGDLPPETKRQALTCLVTERMEGTLI